MIKKYVIGIASHAADHVTTEIFVWVQDDKYRATLYFIIARSYIVVIPIFFTRDSDVNLYLVKLICSLHQTISIT